jgi:putative membrane protein
MLHEPGTSAPDALILRDYLALDRTVLANERTLLAYVRTALALVALGATGVSLFDNRVLQIIGWAIMAAGGLAVLIGARRFHRVRIRLAAIPRTAQ